MIAAHTGVSLEAERFSLAASRERWLDFLGLEHATLPLAADFEREAEELIVRRLPIAGRRIADRRIAKDQAALLFLQAAGLGSFLQAFGFWLAEEDLTEAVHDLSETGPRLWLTRTPRCVSAGGSGPAPSAVLASLLHRLFWRGRRMEHPGARALFDRMLADDAPFRRAEFWLASAFRAFPDLGGPAAAGARARTIGFAGSFLREPEALARLAKARALCEGRAVRVFEAGASSLTPGGALGLVASAESVAQTARALRSSQERAGGRRPLWIAVAAGSWDSLSRGAFETASRALAPEIEVLRVDGAGVAPRLPDEWRREVFVPCGTLAASLRFYEKFAELARPDPSAAATLAQALAASPEWAAFVSDPTGDGPFPGPFSTAGPPSIPAAASLLPPEREILEAMAVRTDSVASAALTRLLRHRSTARSLEQLEKRGEIARDIAGQWRATAAGRARISVSAAKRRSICLRWAETEEEPGRRIELLLEGGDVEEALSAAQQWLSTSGAGTPERWFGLSSRLAAAAGSIRPVWLEQLEAEREIAGGRLEEARTRLLAIVDSADASSAEKRAARLRAAEALARRSRHGAAGREAAAWRAEFPDAPADERVRALRIDAASRTREGEYEKALKLLEEAERQGSAGSLGERLETALAQAGVYSLAGRFREEEEVYERWRGAVLEAGNDRLAARLLSHQAMALSDRREFAAAIARFEEALAVSRDDVAERARLSFDLAAALFHGGRIAPCGRLLEEAIELASSVGREDLVRAARCNRIELAIHRSEWDEASREIDVLLAQADEQEEQLHRLIALHQRSRVALSRGRLENAERDNAEARALAVRLGDRLEIGELWLEEGDRALFAGDFEAARSAWERAAANPPDRCNTDVHARERLRQLAWRAEGRPPEGANTELAKALTGDEYSAALEAARWRILFGAEGVESKISARAQEILRTRGGASLADRVFGPASEPPSGASNALRDLRDAVAAALAGEAPEAPLKALGLAALSIRDEAGHEVAHLSSDSREVNRTVSKASRTLAAGAARYELTLWPAPAAERLDVIALLVETLLYRAHPTTASIEFAQGWRRFQIITADPAMEEPYRRLARFAPQPVTVLVLGESGSGKEAVARAVHQLSPRASGPFVPVNVPAIPAPLLESELFGHARGAFTGADRDRRGLLEEAGGGTIFFDEIGDLSLPLQAKLLRALQEREVRRVGENRARSIDVRVVSATSRPLAADVERGAFREDLYYRLHVAVIHLPPLRERGRDAALLSRHFLERYAREYGRGKLQFSPEALAALSAHGWPGNVRELQNAIAQAAALAEPDGFVTEALLPDSLARARRAAAPAEGYRSRVDAHRRDLISEALEKSGGNRTRAARDLGLSRQALLYLIRELHVTPRPRTGH